MLAASAGMHRANIGPEMWFMLDEVSSHSAERHPLNSVAGTYTTSLCSVEPVRAPSGGWHGSERH